MKIQRNSLYLVIIISLSLIILKVSVSFCRASEADKNYKAIRVLINGFKFDEAKNEVLGLIKEDPKNSNYLYLLGEAIRNKLFFARYRELSREAEKQLVGQAEIAYKESLIIDPEMVKSRIGLGKLYYFLKEYHKALDNFLLAIKMGANDAEVSLTVAKIYRRMGDEKQSKKYYRHGATSTSNFYSNGVNKFDREDVINIRKHSIFLRSSLFWKVADKEFFKQEQLGKSVTEDIIYDAFIGSLIPAVVKHSDGGNLILTDEIKIEIIEDSNNSVLLERGLKLVDIEIILKSGDTHY